MHSESTRDSSPPRLAFRLAPDPQRLQRARERVRDYLWLYCDNARLIADVVLCVEEAATNAIRHSRTRSDMEIELRFDDRLLVATVKDAGRGFDPAGFNPDALPDPTSVGGRGLYLIAHLMDKLELRVDGGLEVEMVKRAVPCRPPRELDPVTGHLAGPRERARTLTFLEEIGEGFFALDWDYRVVHVNAAVLRMTGRPREELLGRRPWEVWPAFADTPAYVAIRDAMELGRSDVVEYRSASGGVWVEARIYPTTSGVCAYYREITVRKEAEEELRRYRLLSEQARDIMLFVRFADGRILEANRAAEQAYGYTRDELLAKRIFELRAPETEPNVREQMEAAQETGIIFETVHQRADGALFAVEVSARGTSTIDGEVVLLSIIRDISERKHKEHEREALLEELRESRHDLARAQAVAHTGSWRLDVRRDELVWSDETYRMFGLALGTPLTYEAFLACVHPDDRALVDAEWTAALHGAPYDIEHRIVAGDAVKWVHERAEMDFDDKGALLGGFGTVTDITESKAADDEHRRLASKLRAQATELQRLYEQQCDIATTLQASFLHPLPKLAGWEFGLASRTASAAELIGGDFHDVYAPSNDQLMVLLGDVEGKGIGAAGMTETVHVAARALAASGDSPSRVLERLNRLLVSEETVLVTALFAIVDRPSGALRISSAGHLPPLHLRRDGSVGPLPLAPGLPLGAFEKSRYRASTAQLAPGEALLLFTDGVIDARRDGAFFGEQGALRIAARLVGRPAQEIADGVGAAVIDYADSLRDDVHILVVRRGSAE